MAKRKYLTPEVRTLVVLMSREGMSSRKLAKEFGVGKSTIGDFLRKETYQDWWEIYDNLNIDKIISQPEQSESVFVDKTRRHLPKVLVFDLETAPNRGAFWGLWQQNIGLNMITHEWFLLSYAAKWLGDHESNVMYNDMRGVVDTEDDRHLLEEMWNLLDQADIVVTQNGKKFDVKKINARFILNGFQPPSSYKHIDTLQLAKANFAFTSNKLAWMTDKLNVHFKKLDHGKFSGYDLWAEMLKDNPEAWQECEDYNKYDVFSLEELYLKLAAWDKKHPNFSLYFDEPEQLCRCGSSDFKEDGYAYTSLSKFQRYKCTKCGAESRSRKNLFTKAKRDSLHMNIVN